MARKILLLVLIMIFAFGWFCSSAYSTVSSQISLFNQEDMGDNIEFAGSDTSLIDRYIFNNKERISPSDWIQEEQIHVYSDKIVIDLLNPQWATFTDTNSMDPVIDAGTHAIELVPGLPEQIQVGDIVSYESEYVDGVIIHRVVDIGEDSDGWYCKTKGDNNPFEDPGKIRFHQIKRVLVAIIY
jgi:hypothetical protein